MHLKQPSLLIVFSALPLFSCKLYHRDKQMDPGHYFEEAYTGYDLNGNAKTCFKNSKPASCPPAEGPQEEFATACKTKGHSLYQCACHDYLCSANLAGKDANAEAQASFSGYDEQGRKRSCQAMTPQTICTQSFGPEDQFAIDCAKQGFTYFQCGCHDYICSGKISL